IFTLTQVEFNFSYVAGEATGSFAAAFWLIPPTSTVSRSDWFSEDPPEGAVALEVSAAYAGKEGWSFRGGLAPDSEINLRKIVGLYLPPEYQDFVPEVSITKL